MTTTQYVKFDILITGLKPNTIHSAFFDGIDTGASCAPVVPSTNYALAFAGVKQAYPSKDAAYWHKQVLFNGWNKNVSNVRLSDVVSKKPTGTTLTSNSDGVLAFTLFYTPAYALQSNIRNAANVFRSLSFTKQLNVKSSDGTSRAIVTIKSDALKTNRRLFGIERCNNVIVNLVNGPGSGTGGSTTTPTGVTSNTVSNNSLSTIISQFDIAQTWLVDPDRVGNVEEVYISKVDLFFRSKPEPTNGILNPGVTVYITPVVNRIPHFTNLNEYPSARQEYADIQTSNNATTATTFTFPVQGKVATGREYCFVIKYDGRAPFVIWKSKQGDPIVGTTTSSQGPTGNYIGLYYEYTTDITNWRALHDTDLKFNIYAARYTGSPYINFVSDNYEFINFKESTSDPRFLIGERVFQLNANQTGTVSVSNTSTTITGTSTLFTTLWQGGGGDPEFIVLRSGDDYCVREVISVASNTSLIIDQPPPFTNAASVFTRSPVARVASVKNSYLDGGKARMVVLTDSSANSTVYFQATNTIRGELSNMYIANVSLADLKTTRISPSIDIDTSGTGTYTVNGKFFYKWTGSNTQLASPELSRVLQDEVPIIFTKDEAVVFPSRSNEFVYGSLVNSSDDSKTSQINVAVIQTTTFVSPRINGDAFLQAFRYVINNDYTDENTKYGNSYSKHVSKKINLDANTAAEDLIVYLTAVRPANTDLKVFCKLYNTSDSDAFDDKDWTLMEQTGGVGLYSGSKNDQIELTYTIPQYPNTDITGTGMVTTTTSEANLVGSGTSFTTEFVANDVIKVYSSLFPTNYILGVVDVVANDTLMSLKSVISNTSVTGSGFKVDKIKYPQQAFRNITNDNVVRYYSESKIEYDTFNTFAIKIVFLSDNDYVVPLVKNIRSTAVSA